MPAPVFLHARTAARLIRVAVPLAIAAVCLWFLAQRLGTLDLAVLWHRAASIGPMNWAGAVAATVVSFWALGCYDVVAHRHLGTDVPRGAARRAGMCAIALSQTLGLGLVTGAFARWRQLPGVAPLMALRLTGFVAVTFVVSLTVCLSAALLLTPLAPGLTWLALACLALAAVAVALAFFRPVLRFGSWRLRLPSLPAIAAIAFWTLIDTGAAALALYLLIPAGAGIDATLIFPAYLAALGAALVSGTPGGVGPFELVLLALLPGIDPGALMIGVVGFRLVYFALPALVAGAIVLTRPPQAAAPAQAGPEPALAPARAETGLLRQNGGRILRHRDGAIAAVETAQATIGLFDPVAGDTDAALALLARRARRGNRVPLLYKCTARTAWAARNAGWRVLRVSRDAVLDPVAFDLDRPGLRQLRRKLRQGERAGLRVTPGGDVLPLAAMSAVDHAWQLAKGPARGTTMGRFCPDYLSRQRVYLAWTGDRLAGFVSLHDNGREWCLDLMRARPDAPVGTMQALVHAAIADARDAGLTRLSLAAVPDHALTRARVPGLEQFKASFAPAWQPLYVAAPGWCALALAAADLARLLLWPETPEPAPAADRRPHEDDEKNGFALPGPT